MWPKLIVLIVLIVFNALNTFSVLNTFNISTSAMPGHTQSVRSRAAASSAQATIQAAPPTGVMAPSQRVPVSASR